MNLFTLLIFWASFPISPGVSDRETVARPSPCGDLKILECGHDSRAVLRSSDARPSDAPVLADLGETLEEEDDHRPDAPADLVSSAPPVYVPDGLLAFASHSRNGVFRRLIRNLPIRC